MTSTRSRRCSRSAKSKETPLRSNCGSEANSPAMASANRRSTVCRSDFSSTASARHSTTYRRRLNGCSLLSSSGRVESLRSPGVLRRRASSLSTCSVHWQCLINHSRSHAACRRTSMKSAAPFSPGVSSGRRNSAAIARRRSCTVWSCKLLDIVCRGKDVSMSISIPPPPAMAQLPAATRHLLLRHPPQGDESSDSGLRRSAHRLSCG